MGRARIGSLASMLYGAFTSGWLSNKPGSFHLQSESLCGLGTCQGANMMQLNIQVARVCVLWDLKTIVACPEVPAAHSWEVESSGVVQVNEKSCWVARSQSMAVFPPDIVSFAASIPP